MSLTEFALTTLDTVKTELGIALTDTSKDAVIERQINAVSDRIRRFTNRIFQFEQDIVEKLAGFSFPNIVLSRTPIIQITEIQLNDVILDADEFEITDTEAGIIFRLAGWDWSALRARGIVQDKLAATEEQTIQVTYNAGFVTPQQVIDDPLLTRTLPFDLEEATILATVSFFQQRGSDLNIKSESLMSASVTYNGRMGLPETVMDMLKPYVRIISG